MPTAEPLGSLVADAAPLLEGARIEKVHAARGDIVALTVRRRGEPKRCLIVGLHQRAVTFHLAATRPPALAPPPEACVALRRKLERSFVERIRISDDDRAVVLELSGARRLRYAVGRGRAALELDGPEGMHVAIVSGFTAGADALAGAEPTVEPAAADDVGVPESHRIAGEQFRTRQAEAIVEEARARVGRVLRLAAKRQRRLTENVRRDLEKAGDADEHLRRGELLKSALGRLRRGMATVEVADWYDPDGGMVTLALDPVLTPSDNVERCFRKYRKAKRTHEVATQRLERAERDRAEIELLAERLREATSLDELVELEAASARWQRGSAAAKRPGTKGPKRAGALGPRRFVSLDGLEVLVARSSTGNDELTFRIAHGNDLFLHVAGRPGAHVVVRLPGGRPVPEDTLIDAAHLAVWFSLRKEARAAEGEGFSADVDYAPIKHVRRARGAGPGKVLLGSRRTIHVRIEPARLRRLTGSGGFA